MITTLKDNELTVWEDFTLVDEESYNTQIIFGLIECTDKAKLVALNFSRYVGFNGTGYGEGTVDRGITEQEAFDTWSQSFDQQQQVLKRQLESLSIKELPQCVFDGLMLYFWATGKILYVYGNSDTYTLRKHIIDNNWDMVASMMVKSAFNKDYCIRAANILRLADYGKAKPRSWFRTQGIYHMRNLNERNQLDDAELRRARFAYYAETRKFLPFTPESNKRQIVKEYESTLITQQFTYTGNKVFTLSQVPSMTPVEKLEVSINGDLVQNEFDYTLNGPLLIVTRELNQDDIIISTIRI